MNAIVRPVPDLGDFIEVIASFGQADLANLQSDILAYESGNLVSRGIEEALARVECLAEANRIMARFG